MKFNPQCLVAATVGKSFSFSSWATSRGRKKNAIRVKDLRFREFVDFFHCSNPWIDTLTMMICGDQCSTEILYFLLLFYGVFWHVKPNRRRISQFLSLLFRIEWKYLFFPQAHHIFIFLSFSSPFFLIYREKHMLNVYFVLLCMFNSFISLSFSIPIQILFQYINCASMTRLNFPFDVNFN